MRVSLVAAQSTNHVIGRGADIPWKVKGEQALFKRITMNGTLVMGRKTFDSIGRPLPGRHTIVLSSNPELQIDGCDVAGSLEDALVIASHIDRPVFIAGGGQLYKQTIDQADALHLTTIHTAVEGDVFFPAVPEDFRLVRQETYESNIDYTYRFYERHQGGKT